MSEQRVVSGICLTIEHGKEGLFYGTSSEAPGLLIAGKTTQEIVDQVPQALAELNSARCSRSTVS